MAEPQIKSSLEAPELTTNQTEPVRRRLAACLASDPQHITPGPKTNQTDVGAVKAIQDGLELIRQRMPDLGLLVITDPPGTYGTSTTQAVLKYKQINDIKRTGQPIDSIVGRMTITQIDNDLVHGSKPIPPPVVIDAPVEIAAVNDDLAKDDLTFGPAPPGTLSGKQLVLILERRKKATGELEDVMKSDLLLGGKFGPILGNDFFRNVTPPSKDFTISHGAGTEFSDFVASTVVWRSISLDFRIKLDQQIKALGVNGPFAAIELKDRIPPPVPTWSPNGLANAAARGLKLVGGLSDADDKMLVLVGSFQGSRVFLHEFAMNPANRRYTGILFYELIDHFGVDADDIIFDFHGHGTDGQVAFWVLQHERHVPGHMPYRLKVVIREIIDGTF